MTAPYRTPSAGELLANRYELGQHIDSGGMAEVWEAKDHTLGRTVAVKILHAHLARDAAFLRRFRREAVNAARLQHPTIVAIYDAVSFDGLEAIVMERIEGRTLRSVLDEHNKLPARDVIDMGRQISQALHVAHEAGVVHRDIKPSNIMLCEDRRIRVTDFGIAKAGEDTDLTRTGTLLGTAKYLAPEQVLGDEVDARSDLYGLGVVLFEALAGRPPFDEGNDYATAQARVISIAPRLSQFRPDLPATLDRLIERLLDQDPDERPESAMELGVLLSSIRIESEDFTSTATGQVDLTTIDLRAATAPPVTSETEVGGISGSGADTTGDLAFTPSHLDGDPPEDDDLEPRRPTRFSVGALVLLVVVASAIITVVALLDRFGDQTAETDSDGPGVTLDLSNDDNITLTPTETFVPPVIAAGRPIDPLGPGDGEMDELAANAIDGDDDTAWTTERYSKPGFSGAKAGVGYLISFQDPSVLTRLVLRSPTEGWSAKVFVGAAAIEGTDGWDHGPYELIDIDGDAQIDFDGTTGSHLLIWLTFEGRSPLESDESDDEFENRFTLTEVIVE